MAYVVSETLPDPKEADAGEVIPAAYFREIGAALNQAHAVSTPNVIAQSWPDGTHSFSGGAVLSCRWRFPTATNAHTTLSIILSASAGGSGGGSVTFSAVNSNQSQTIQVVNQTQTETTTTITIDGSNTLEELTMTVTPASPGSVTVWSVDAEILPLSGPLSAGVDVHRDESGSDRPFFPIGSATLADNTPISAHVGHMLRTNIDTLRRRRRCYGTWSRAALGGSFGWYPHQAHTKPQTVIVPAGSERAEIPIRFAILAENPGNTDTVIVVTLSPVGWFSSEGRGQGHSRSVQVTIPQQTALSWHEGTIDTMEGHRLPNATPYFLNLTLNNLNGPVAGVHALTVWSE